MKIYRVGGAVRDELLGYPHSETDWVVGWWYAPSFTRSGL
jgi:tRNA nucleotidyltransferase/poly(A) polymerase